MTGLLLILAALVTAGLLAATARLPSLVSTLLVAYIAFVANLGLVTLVLSPFRAVTREGLALGEGALLVGALLAWFLSGRPALRPGDARAALRELAGSPVAALFVALVAALLLYELVLALGVPPNNWDSLTYHLARAAAWAQHGGIYWIPNAPTDRLNEFQPLAEQENLFFFVATGNDALFALPQYLAQLAILVAVYGASRRVGFGVAPAACSAALLATCSLIALESTTAQNDLVAASFPAVAACLVLGGGGLEAAIAGAAFGIGLGAKLTTVLVLPVLVWLACQRGRRTVERAALGAGAGLAAIGIWSFVLNVAHTGRLLGHGGGRLEDTAGPSFPGSLKTSLHVLYRALDVSVLSNSLIDRLAVAGLVAAAVSGAWAYHRQAGTPRRRSRRAALCAGSVGAPFVAPLLVVGAAAAVAYLTKQAHIPVRERGFAGGLNRSANEDYSAFGPIGSAVLLAVPVLTAAAWQRRQAPRLALACALPLFLILLGLQARYNPFLTRFLVVPAVLTAPLFGILFRSRAATAALLAVASLSAVLTVEHDRTKPFASVAGRPWSLSQTEALGYVFDPAVAPTYAAYRRLVPAGACVGAAVGPDEPSFLLWGPSLTHRVDYLPAIGALAAAYRSGVFYAVISRRSDAASADEFEAAGWTIRPLGDLWLLASDPRAGAGGCSGAR